MKTFAFFAISLCVAAFIAAGSARADFSYTTTRKATGGAMAAMAGAAANGSAKYYFKGQKMKIDNGDTAVIVDFDAQTVTTVNNRQKTVSVKSFSQMNAAAPGNTSMKIDVKETGQKKTINGYNASELILTADVESPATAQMGKMQMEMDMWLSPDVPGAGELRAFYQKNMSRFPWAALGGGGNAGMQSGMVELQRKIAEMNGVQVLQVVKMKAPGAAGAPGAPGAPGMPNMPNMPQMTPAQTAQMQQAMQRLQQLQAQGGPAAAAAAQAMARMGAAQGGGAPGTGAGAGSGSLMEITMESGDFSTSSIPDAVFAIPAGYQKADK